MIISRGEIFTVLRTYTRQAAAAGTGGPERGRTPPGPRAGDRVDISREAQEAQRLRQYVSGLPDIRQDKVERIARALADGTYRVNGDEVAEKMLGRVLVDRLL